MPAIDQMLVQRLDAAASVEADPIKERLFTESRQEIVRLRKELIRLENLATRRNHDFWERNPEQMGR